MFPEATLFRAELVRELKNGTRITTRRGTWHINVPHSRTYVFRWRDFVNQYRLDQLETWTRSKGTFADTARYFTAALNYVAARIPEDKETNRLILKMRVRPAGQIEVPLELQSDPRISK